MVDGDMRRSFSSFFFFPLRLPWAGISTEYDEIGEGGTGFLDASGFLPFFPSFFFPFFLNTVTWRTSVAMREALERN